MTEVCLVGDPEVNLRYELLSRETARGALSAYELREPFANSLGLETVSLGAAVAVLNDLDWYLRRFVAEAITRDPSIAAEEWLSRELATAIRTGSIDPDATGGLLKVFGLIDGRPVEPMYLVRRDGTIPEYDLRDVEETLVVRVTESEFAG